MMNETMAREIREARAAGIRALNSLRKAQDYLNSARGWGILDMLGGGMISSLIKHSKLSDAQRCIDQAQYDLDAFRRELADVNLPYAEIDGFLTFADFFFDGLLSDLIVQSRIRDAIARLDDACRQVEDVLYRLENL